MNQTTSIALSAAILVHNSERTITACLESLKGLVDEVVIVDDHSSDSTVDKVKAVFPDAKILTRSLDSDFASQRNFSLQNCQHPWVVCIDSDEVLSKELQASIRKVVLSSQEGRAFNCWRMNENIAGWSPELLDRPILMRRELTWFGKIHEKVEDELQLIEGKLYHHAWTGMDGFIDDLNKYSSWKMNSWFAQNRDYPVVFLVIRQIFNALYRFLKRLFWEKRYKGGWVAVLYCLAWASEELFVGLKYIEKKKVLNRES